MPDQRRAQPRISVLMGAYNTADTLPEAIQSIQAQTFTDWELIIFDDGSSDDTLSVAQRFAAEDNRVIVYSNGRNLGLAPTLNNCLAQSRGEILARMDADDHCDPQRFHKQLHFLETNPTVALVGSAVLFFDAEGTWGQTKAKESPQPRDLVHGTPFAHPSVMIRRKALEAVGGYDTAGRCWRVEDFDLWLRLYLAGYRGRNLSEPLVFMRNDRAAAGRRTWRARWNESRVLASVVRQFEFPKYEYFRVARPILLALIPGTVYMKFHRQRYAK